MIISYTYAQNDKDRYLSLSYGVDVRNALIGSQPTDNKPALNWTAEFHAVEENIDFNIGMERFNMLEYTRVFVGLGYHIQVLYLLNTDIKFSVHPSIEFSNINRTFNESVVWEGKTVTTEVGKSFSTPSFNINWNWDLHKNVAIQIGTNVLPRRDIQYIYKEDHMRVIVSNSLKLVYKFNNH